VKAALLQKNDVSEVLNFLHDQHIHAELYDDAAKAIQQIDDDNTIDALFVDYDAFDEHIASLILKTTAAIILTSFTLTEDQIKDQAKKLGLEEEAISGYLHLPCDPYYWLQTMHLISTSQQIAITLTHIVIPPDPIQEPIKETPPPLVSDETQSIKKSLELKEEELALAAQQIQINQRKFENQEEEKKRLKQDNEAYKKKIFELEAECSLQKEKQKELQIALDQEKSQNQMNQKRLGQNAQSSEQEQAKQEKKHQELLLELKQSRLQEAEVKLALDLIRQDLQNATASREKTIQELNRKNEIQEFDLKLLLSELEKEKKAKQELQIQIQQINQVLIQSPPSLKEEVLVQTLPSPV
jgi:hypothetical protein